MRAPKNPNLQIKTLISNVGRPGTADEVANVAELLMSDKVAFITGSTFLIDSGATSSYFYGPLKPRNNTAVKVKAVIRKKITALLNFINNSDFSKFESWLQSKIYKIILILI